ncbi:hypothetical protein KM043_002916 [Ampulex compressa]|nr:hypothetical protein KM043_002916 [Ampulex compressa]
MGKGAKLIKYIHEEEDSRSGVRYGGENGESLDLASMSLDPRGRANSIGRNAQWAAWKVGIEKKRGQRRTEERRRPGRWDRFTTNDKSYYRVIRQVHPNRWLLRHFALSGGSYGVPPFEPPPE